MPHLAPLLPWLTRTNTYCKHSRDMATKERVFFRILAGRCGMDSVSFSRRLISVEMDLLDVGADILTWI